MQKKILLIHALVLFVAVHATAQLEPQAGQWKTWFIPSVKTYRLPAPATNKEELAQVLAAQRALDSADMQKIIYWNAGAPGYRWCNLSADLWMSGISDSGAVANMLVGAAIYDATIAAWDTKYAYNRTRPFSADSKVKLHAANPQSPSYPCEYSVAAGAAVAIISHFYPSMGDSVKRMAEQLMTSRIAAGLAYPSDVHAGFELGKKIGIQEIDQTKDFFTTRKFDGNIPNKPGLWNGKFAWQPMAGYNKTVVLDSASQFRPAPPPDFAKEMAEMKSFKQTFKSRANAFHYASQDTGGDLLTKKIFEYNLHTNPPRAARLYAAVHIAYYDAFTACWDAKYAYWGIRPDQYDTTYTPLVPTPPFPGYPSGHAMMCGVVGELFPYFFPYDKPVFMKIAKDGAESRFHAGIHFRSDNNAGLELGKNVAVKVVERLKADGAENEVKFANAKNSKVKNQKAP